MSRLNKVLIISSRDQAKEKSCNDTGKKTGVNQLCQHARSDHTRALKKRWMAGLNREDINNELYMVILAEVFLLIFIQEFPLVCSQKLQKTVVEIMIRETQEG